MDEDAEFLAKYFSRGCWLGGLGNVDTLIDCFVDMRNGTLWRSGVRLETLAMLGLRLIEIPRGWEGSGSSLRAFERREESSLKWERMA